jgi:hypothetical protein
MTQDEYQKALDAIIDKVFREEGLDPDDPNRGELTEEQSKRVTERLVVVTDAKAERDPEFASARLDNLAARDIAQWIKESRPTGEYRENNVIPLNGDGLKFMKHADREDLLAWALLESDERNLEYIRSRLDHWDKRPEIKTLKDLEEAIR